MGGGEEIVGKKGLKDEKLRGARDNCGWVIQSFMGVAEGMRVN